MILEEAALVHVVGHVVDDTASTAQDWVRRGAVEKGPAGERAHLREDPLRPAVLLVVQLVRCDMHQGLVPVGIAVRRNALCAGPAAHRSDPRDAMAHGGAEHRVIASREDAATPIHPLGQD